MSATLDPTPVALVPLRRNRDFLLLWTGAGFSSLGLQLTFVVYPLLVVWQTGSASAAGNILAAAVLPHLVVQLPAGALVDRFDRRRLMIASDLVCIAVTGGVLVAVFFDAIWLPHLMAAAFLHGSAAIIYELAERTAVRHLVDESQVALALGQNEARKRAVGMLGDPIGTFLFSLVRWTPFLVTVVVHVVSLVELLLIRTRFQAERDAPSAQSFRADIAEGVRWLWGQAFLRTAMLLIAASNLVFAGLVLTLILIVHRAGVSPAAVGLVLAAGGLGGVAGALSASWWRRRLSIGVLLPGGLLVWTLAILPLAFVDDPFVIGALFAFIGLIGGICNVIGYLYAVEITPDGVLGRVMSVMMLVGSGASFLGALVIGHALDASGIPITVYAMAAVMAVLVVVGWLHPAVRHVDRVPSDDSEKGTGDQA